VAASPIVTEASPRAATSAPEIEDLGPLIDRARTGDQGAFGELYRRFARVVHGIILSRIGPGEAEDVAQEVFASIFRKLGAVSDAATFPGWICAAARNAATDELRRRKRAVRATSLDAVDPAAPAADRERELRERVLARIQELPDAYRETLVLRLVEGLTGPEIAERTGLSPASVRVNLCRGMEKLRPLLQREGWP
jgi:RNA polymerase sigma-70 factor (ECF subfamily)